MSVESKTINVAIMGAGGNIGYQLLPKVVDGLFLPDSYGENYKVNLRLMEPAAFVGKLGGTIMELEDMALPHLGNVEATDDPAKAYDGVNLVFLLGGIPRKEGMTRADLLEVNAPLFIQQGEALNENAADDVRVVTVSNPANSIALTVADNAADIPKERFAAMSRLDHNRALSLLATHLSVNPGDLERLGIWGNHSPTMVTDISNVLAPAQAGGSKKARILCPGSEWYEEFSSQVANRGTTVIKARGASSAASAAWAAADMARDWLNGSDGRWHSMGLFSHGEYDMPEGIISSYPVTTEPGGEVEIVPNLEVSQDMRSRLDKTAQELLEERAALIKFGAVSDRY